MKTVNIRITGFLASTLISGSAGNILFAQKNDLPLKRHNIILGIADDQSYPYNSAYQSVKKDLRKQLLSLLTKQGDRRILGTGDIFDSYPRFGAMRDLGGFREEGKYNPAFMQK